MPSDCLRGVSEVLEDEPGGRRPQEWTRFPPPSPGLPSIRTYVSSPSSVSVDMAPCSSSDGPESSVLCLGRISLWPSLLTLCHLFTKDCLQMNFTATMVFHVGLIILFFSFHQKTSLKGHWKRLT